ncbi:MAG TPA: zf-HC2 domain-containing protein [Pyrinomonadaceae bacterium]|nr:zf-HC2 domain-containing protein [Pyrinomonadaceae bacterium]
MQCDEIQELLSLYCDDGLAEDERTRCDGHLEVCPVCRDEVSQLRALRLRLAAMPSALAPANLVPVIQNAMRAEVVVQRARRRAPRSEAFFDFISFWLAPRPMRYAFSSIMSILLFGTVFMALRPHMIALHEAASAFDAFNLASAASSSGYDINEPISSSNYAALRAPFNAESPSLDPKGGLATLNLSDGHSEKDDMVVVADVFSNGSASLADVMHAPRDRRMLDDFQAALRSNAAFVPASIDRRPETMRVVFSIQHVEVRDRNY